MTEDMNNIEELVDKNEKLIDIWGRRTPKFEKKYEQTVMRVISDYGVGASENTGAKGKVLGAGYEPYIMAFFIGLYAGKKLPLSEDSDDLKVLDSLCNFGAILIRRKLEKLILRCVLIYLWLSWQRQILIGLPWIKVI